MWSRYATDGLKRGDYSDPGPYQHPVGTLASEYTAQLAPPARAAAPLAGPQTLMVRKP